MDNKYENISTCITIVNNDLDALKTNIINAIVNNFENRLSLLGIERKCPNITFAEGTGNSIDINYNIKNSVGDIVRTITLANLPYEYDTTNIYLSYNKSTTNQGYEISENINKYSVLLCFTTTETVLGFSILSPSMLVSNNDNTYSIKVSNNDSVISFTQDNDFMSYDTILEQGLNPDNIDFNNLYIRNKLIDNPNCYYELDFTDLIDNDTIKSIPYINDRFYDITEIDSSYTEYSIVNTYTICSVLSTTRINYSISEYPVLFPKTITAQDNTIKGYLNYVYDIPTQKIDTGDSINNLYSGQLINLEDSQYVLCDANTIVQIDNLIITGGNTSTTYTGRFHNYDIIYPKNDDIKVFSTLNADPTIIVDIEQNQALTLFDKRLRTPVSESIHSWYQYNSNLLEYSGVNAGNYDYLYKVCIPTGDNNLLSQKPVFKQEYLRLHKVTEIDEGNILKQYPFIRYKKASNPSEYTPLSYMTSFTTISSAIQPQTISDVDYDIKLILQLYKIKLDDEGTPYFDDIVYTEQSPYPLTIEATVDRITHKIVYVSPNESVNELGEIVFSNILNGTRYGAEIRLYSGQLSDEVCDDDEIREKLKNDVLIFNIDNEYYTVSDLAYISYYYLPDLYLEYYGYTNTYIERANLVGYYVNKDTVVKYNENDDPIVSRKKPRYGLDYYFATGKRVIDTANNYIILINDIKLYMALDNNGEPGEWHLIVPDDKINTDISDGFKYSIGPQHTFGYPLYPNDANQPDYPDSGLPALPEDSDPNYLSKTKEILNQQLEYFSANTYTGLIWYKIECDNFNTIIDYGNVTITDIPVSEVVPEYDPNDPETITNYKFEDNLADQGEPELVDSNVDDTDSMPIIQGYLYNGTFYLDIAHTESVIAETGVIYIDLTDNTQYLWIGNQFVPLVQGYLYEGTFYTDQEHTESITPETNKVYLDLTTNKLYNWNGTSYVII